MSGVHSGYRASKPRERWLDTFIAESLRVEIREVSGRYFKLRAAVQDYLHARGKENEGEYLTRLRHLVGRWEGE